MNEKNNSGGNGDKHQKEVFNRGPAPEEETCLIQSQKLVQINLPKIRTFALIQQKTEICNKVFCCDKCSEAYSTKRKLKVHINRNHAEPVG